MSEELFQDDAPVVESALTEAQGAMPAPLKDEQALLATAANQPHADARMVTYARGKFVAFAPNATQELIEHPQWMHVPGAAYYAYGLMHWQDRHIPFIHLESVLLAYPAFDPSATPPFALVLAYQHAPREPLQYGAIAVQEIPYSQPVSDADFSPLPSDSDMWEELAISCFSQKGQIVPILDAAKIFGKYHG